MDRGTSRTACIKPAVSRHIWWKERPPARTRTLRSFYTSLQRTVPSHSANTKQQVPIFSSNILQSQSNYMGKMQGFNRCSKQMSLLPHESPSSVTTFEEYLKYEYVYLITRISLMSLTYTNDDCHGAKRLRELSGKIEHSQREKIPTFWLNTTQN